MRRVVVEMEKAGRFDVAIGILYTRKLTPVPYMPCRRDAPTGGGRARYDDHSSGTTRRGRRGPTDMVCSRLWQTTIWMEPHPWKRPKARGRTRRANSLGRNGPLVARDAGRSVDARGLPLRRFDDDGNDIPLGDSLCEGCK